MSYDPCPHGREPSVCEQCPRADLDAVLDREMERRRAASTPPIVGPRVVAPHPGVSRADRRAAQHASKARPKERERAGRNRAMGTHGIDVCLCGNVIAQCRCPGPHERRVVRQLCDACRASQEVPHAVAPESAPLRAEGPGGAKTARERAIGVLTSEWGTRGPARAPTAQGRAANTLAALEAAGLRVVDAAEHERDRRLLREAVDALAAGPGIAQLGGR